MTGDRRLTSHRRAHDLCLYRAPLAADDGWVEQRPPIYRQTCVQCDRPALTFDAQDRALCSRHATSFVGEESTADDDEDDEPW